MRPDRDEDWESRVAESAKKKTRDRAPQLREIQRAALAAEHVTGNEHWDNMLSIVQSRLDSLRTSVETAVNELKDSDIFTAENLINQKLTVRLLGKEVEALEWVIGLPTMLMEQGDQARKLLETIEESSN